MSGRGNKAVLPPPDYERRPTLDATGLVVRPLGQGGEDLGTWDFSDLPGPESFRRELAAAFDARARGHWNSFNSSKTYAKTLRRFIRNMAELEFPPGSVGEIALSAWQRWAEAENITSVRQLEQVLRELPSLAPEVAAAMSRRGASRQPKEKKTSFTNAEMKQIRDAAAGTVRRARLRIGENTAVLRRWREGLIPKEEREWAFGELLDHLSRTGDLPRFPSGGPKRSVLAMCRAHNGAHGSAEVLTLLFPTIVEKAAAAVLLICHEGWNLSVLEKIKIPSQWPNGDGDQEEPAIHRVETDKPRRSRRRHSSNNLVNLGEGTPGWAIQQVTDMTEQVRTTLAGLGRPSDLLLWSRAGKGASHFSDASDSDMFDSIDLWAGQVREAGTPLPAGMSSRQLRHTSQVLFGGPRNNTAAVQENQYERRDSAVIDSSKDVVAAALEEAVRHARESVLMRVATDAGDGKDEAGQVAARTGVSLEVAGRVVRGELDTAVAACEDITNRPIAPTGSCTVSFLLCFACPNALATRRHLPRIVYLFQALESRRSIVTAAVWAADWAAHHTRIAHLLDQHTDPADWLALAAATTGQERDLIDRVLERSLQP